MSTVEAALHQLAFIGHTKASARRHLGWSRYTMIQALADCEEQPWTKVMTKITPAEAALAIELREERCDWDLIALGLSLNPETIAKTVNRAKREGFASRG